MQKIRIALAVMAGLFVGYALAAAPPKADVTLGWDPSPSTVEGYLIHYGVAKGTYTNAVNVGAATVGTVSNLVAGTTYYFAVTAYAAGADSAASNEVGYTVPLPRSVLSEPSSLFLLFIYVFRAH